MVTAPKYLLAQERLHESLEDRLRYWRTSGVSYTAMANMLARETGVVVTHQTIRDWYLRLTETAA